METVERVTRLETQMEGIQSALTDIKADQKAQLRMLGELTTTENRRKGAVAMLSRLAAMTSGGGVVGALIVKLLHL